MSLRANNRWQAFGIHIVISLVIFLGLAAIIYFFWYPGFLFHYDGGLEGMKLIAGVDFVIGPLLTLLVYQVGKKTLKFDLACIAFLQLVCLTGGMWTIWQTRPVAVVYAAGTYATVDQADYKDLGYQPEKIAVLRGRWPLWLYVNLPEEQKVGIGALWSLMGENLHASVENYTPYDQAISSLARDGLQAEDIKDAKGDLKELQQGNADVRFFPITTSMYFGYLAVNVRTGEALHFFEKH